MVHFSTTVATQSISLKTIFKLYVKIGIGDRLIDIWLENGIFEAWVHDILMATA